MVQAGTARDRIAIVLKRNNVSFSVHNQEPFWPWSPSIIIGGIP